jgi:hypothetical protein
MTLAQIDHRSEREQERLKLLKRLSALPSTSISWSQFPRTDLGLKARLNPGRIQLLDRLCKRRRGPRMGLKRSPNCARRLVIPSSARERRTSPTPPATPRAPRV